MARPVDAADFDSAVLDFNATTVFSDNIFSASTGVGCQPGHRWPDHPLPDRASGAELARFGIAQRYPRCATSASPPTACRCRTASPTCCCGLDRVVPDWTLDTRCSSTRHRPPGSHHHQCALVTGAAAHALCQPPPQGGGSEQLALGWQWPLADLGRPLAGLLGSRVAPAASSAGDCRGVYGVGALDCSLRDRRLSGAIVGFEYDAGCWIGRVVARRQSTSAQNASTQLMLQLELVGLSRLSAGSNPLSILKDNIPGYRRCATARRNRRQLRCPLIPPCPSRRSRLPIQPHGGLAGQRRLGVLLATALLW